MNNAEDERVEYERILLGAEALIALLQGKKISFQTVGKVVEIIPPSHGMYVSFKDWQKLKTDIGTSSLTFQRMLEIEEKNKTRLK